jgi:hypothetical protein
MAAHPASKQAAQDELDILDIPARQKPRRSIGTSVLSTDKAPPAVPNGTDDRGITHFDRRELAHQ